MHTDKIRIFDEYAKEQDFEPVKLGNEPLEIDDFDDLLLSFRYSNISLPTIKQAIFAACDLVQQEQQKKIVGKSEIDYSISKKSILNPENIIQ
ncbi:hypothetical protein CLU96_1262 [Chryseobacterium sp. 52]|uniref:hypothetical protein n=1 Tax=Chryseobacterium sp. 52 TaxID=2035213 RepID=UPI000C18167B|nr:hypothetical protein [Chryseobacterium sp. 52]PIF44319.1 hypothetical protein CLU96_1262 [Chryseobacterium sp. 52]